MNTFAVEPQGQLLDAAKQAALDAVAGYDRMTRYTVGVAVQAAAAVFRTDYLPPATRSAEVMATPRLRALESLATAARAEHDGADLGAMDCPLCAALREVDQAG